MKVYIEIDDAIGAIYHHFPSIGAAEIFSAFYEAPTVIFTQCEECIHFNHIERCMFGICHRHHAMFLPTDSCSYGQPKEEEPTMEEFMYGQDMGSEEDGSL